MVEEGLIYSTARADPKYNNAPTCIILPGQLQLTYTHPCVSFACEAKRTLDASSVYIVSVYTLPDGGVDIGLLAGSLVACAVDVGPFLSQFVLDFIFVHSSFSFLMRR